MNTKTTHDLDQPILDVKQLSVVIAGHPVLVNLTFHLHVGERVAVLGPNGAGKSTLFKTISGLLAPSSGQVNVYGTTSSRHNCIAYIPQRTQVDWHFPVSVYDVVMMGRTARLKPLVTPGKEHKIAVMKALETVEMADLASRQISQLSGGQQQRMFIARALAQQAELMLMDEPLAGLDDPAQEGLLLLLEKLEKEKVTIMTATHDLDQAARHFNRIMLINRHLVSFGPSKQVLTAENLKIAYGGRLSMIEQGTSFVAVDNSCCDGGEE